MGVDLIAVDLSSPENGRPLLIQINCAHHQIVYGSHWSLNRINFIEVIEFDVEEADRRDLHLIAPELRLDLGVDP